MAPSLPLCVCVLVSTLAALALLSAPVSVSASAANDAACAALSSSAFGGAIQPPVYAAAVLPNVCASIWADDITGARGLLSLPRNGGLIVVSRSGHSGSLVWLNDSNSNGRIDSSAGSLERSTLVTVAGLNHGVALWMPESADPVLLASSDTTVYRWPFALSAPNSTLSDAPAVLVANMPAGGHSTRTLSIDPEQRWLYISVGSDGNIDTRATRGGLWRFDLTVTPRAGSGHPFDWESDGSLFAGGLRNEVALAWDREGALWGAENGADDLNRADIGGDVHNDNPAEEINKFDVRPGAFFGYPYCFSEYALPPAVSQGAGAQWAWPSFMSDGVHTDAWCRNSSNVVKPAAVMPAHTAPLGMRFYPRSLAASAARFAFPTPFDYATGEHLLVAQHGSWDRTPAAGYRLVRFATATASEGLGVRIVGSQQDLFWFDGSAAGGSQTGEGWGRPVDVALGSAGELFLSDDGIGRVVVMRYQNASGETNPVQSSTGGGNNGATAAAAPAVGLGIVLLAILLLMASL